MAVILTFQEEDHTYELDGETLPSVSEICRFIDREVYSDVGQVILDRAAQRGTKVHKATESLDRYGDAEIEDEYYPFMEAYLKFRKEHKCTWEKIEFSTYHTNLRYAMTADRVGVMDGKKVLLDIKTTSALQTVKVTAQLTLYKMALESQGFAIEECYALRLDKEGKYHLKKIEPDQELADSLLYLHNALKKKSRKRKEKES